MILWNCVNSLKEGAKRFDFQNTVVGKSCIRAKFKTLFRIYMRMISLFPWLYSVCVPPGIQQQDIIDSQRKEIEWKTPLNFSQQNFRTAEGLFVKKILLFQKTALGWVEHNVSREH